jgi:hypothetical protein
VKVLLALLAAGKLGKVLLTGGTMIVSVFAYALVFGWWYAVGFVALIFIHEMGHFLAAPARSSTAGASRRSSRRASGSWARRSWRRSSSGAPARSSY